jgi:hypothetical protein
MTLSQGFALWIVTMLLVGGLIEWVYARVRGGRRPTQDWLSEGNGPPRR